MRFNTEAQRHEGTQSGRTALWNSASLCLCVKKPYKKYKRAKDEIAFIESMIKPME